MEKENAEMPSGPQEKSTTFTGRRIRGGQTAINATSRDVTEANLLQVLSGVLPFFLIVICVEICSCQNRNLSYKWVKSHVKSIFDAIVSD